jgi:hypothetical protein
MIDFTMLVLKMISFKIIKLQISHWKINLKKNNQNLMIIFYIIKKRNYKKKYQANNTLKNETKEER